MGTTVKNISRFDMKRRKTGKVSITAVHTVFANSELIIKINFETGLFHVRGTRASSWIDEEFQRISEVFLTGVEPRAEDGERVRQSEASEETTVDRTEGGHAKEDKSETTKKGDKEDDITSVMVEIQALKTAILAIEQGMMKLSGRVDEIEKKL